MDLAVIVGGRHISASSICIGKVPLSRVPFQMA